MESFILILIHFFLRNQWIAVNAGEPMLGIAPCMYSGSYDKNGYFCSNEPMPIDWIPIECTSLVYDAVNFNESLTTNFTEYDENNIKQILNGFNITGIILKNLNYGYSNFSSDFHFDKSFNNNLKIFINLLKKKYNLNIGLYVNASNMIYYSDDQDSTDWFDFVVLNDVVDYYIIGFDNFNLCNEFFIGGIVPMDNVFNYNHSLTTFEKAFNSSKIAKNKIYLEFLAVPTLNNSATEHLPTCCVTYKKYCESDHYNTHWCADNAASFYAKGKFAKDIKAKGIVVKYIDTIDPTAKCDCDNKNKFITFMMMLRGFTYSEPITDCAKLNSISVE
ncbi:uncharacterized protein LOC112602835 [Melanaphis sacchari]|uniref:uncharacterized protein LOC112602835 n=1 Tax=Melanaphis sacchari TaxID=742174 RepID=UPI000DC154FA|nr:uncharacterized protein LOC112602835 [Melanaphis sacchari]